MTLQRSIITLKQLKRVVSMMARHYDFYNSRGVKTLLLPLLLLSLSNGIYHQRILGIEIGLAEILKVDFKV